MTSVALAVPRAPGCRRARDRGPASAVGRPRARLRSQRGLPHPARGPRRAGGRARAAPTLDVTPGRRGAAAGCSPRWSAAGWRSRCSPVAAVPAALAMLAGGPVALWWARGRGDVRVAAALPAALDRVSAGLRAGSTVGEGLDALAAGPSAAGARPPAARRPRPASESGSSTRCAQWSRERPLPGVQAVAGALALAVSVGGACAVALEGLGESLRARDAHHRGRRRRCRRRRGCRRSWSAARRSRTSGS